MMATKTLADLPEETTAKKLGLHERVAANNGALYCLPLDRGLTIALVPCHVPNDRVALVLRVTHHSGCGLRGLPDFDWPATKPGLTSARRALAGLLATGVYWSADLAEFGPEGSQRDHAACSVEIIASEQRAFSETGRLVRTALPPPPAPVPLVACRIYARQNRDGVWETLHPGSWLRHATDQPVDATALEIVDTALAHAARATIRDTDRLAWARENLPRLDASTATRGVLSASHSWLDFGVIETSRGPERIVLVMNDPTAWGQCIDLLERAVARVEDARAQPRGVNYRHVWGTWSKGERAGEIRFPSHVPKPKRAEHLAEQAVFDAWSQRVEAARREVVQIAGWLTCGARFGSVAPTGRAVEDERRRGEIERVRALCERLLAVRLSGLIEYSTQQWIESAMRKDLRALEFASEQHKSISEHGFTIGERAGITPSRYETEPGSEPVAPVTITAITFDTDVRDRLHCRSLVDARGREWSYWPVSRLAHLRTR